MYLSEDAKICEIFRNRFADDGDWELHMTDRGNNKSTKSWSLKVVQGKVNNAIYKWFDTVQICMFLLDLTTKTVEK